MRMSLARTGRLLATSIASKTRGVAESRSDGSIAANGGQFTLFRRMSGGHHGPGVTHEGLTLYPPATWQKVMAEGLSGLMWFWILFRAYHDGNTFLYGHAQHFEHEAHSEEGKDGSH